MIDRKGFYEVTQMIHDHFSGIDEVGLIEIATRPQIDEGKRDLGALVYIIPDSMTIEDKYTMFNMNIAVLDYVDEGKRDFRKMPNFQGVDNLQDVLHMTSTILTNFVNSLDRGALSELDFMVRVAPAEMVIDRVPSLTAGWMLSISIGGYHGGQIC